MKSLNKLFISLAIIAFISFPLSLSGQAGSSGSKLKALIIDGQNNHGIWPKTTMMMKDYLEKSGLFEVDIERTAYIWQGPHWDKSLEVDDIKELLEMYPLETGKEITSVDKPKPDPGFSPDFRKYDVVICNMGWNASPLPEPTRMNFEKYMAEGGGLVVVHAANNSWGDWPEYNKMIGIGGWGGRDENSGYSVYYDDAGVLHRETPPKGDAGSHGDQYEGIITTRAPEHPIMKGIPASWLHARDEMYDRLVGPAENMTVLATFYSDTKGKEPTGNIYADRTGNHEPIMLTVNYGKGRIFHTGMGHMGYSMECVGFITTFLRGTEWAATGKVTQEVPDDFPTADKLSIRKWE